MPSLVQELNPIKPVSATPSDYFGGISNISNILENILWRVVHQYSIYDSPSNNFPIYALFHKVIFKSMKGPDDTL